MKNLLVAISNNPSALHGVKFVSGFFEDLERIRVMLFASLPGNPESDATDITTPSPATTSQAPPATATAERDNLSASFAEALEKSRAILVQAGMPEQNIKHRVEACVRSVEFHLALEGAVGMYDALVLGRRGVESLSQLISESLTERLLATNIKIPCWACRHYQSDRHGILLCVDQSSRLVAMVRHVASICKENPGGSNVTLLHVRTPGEGQAEAEDVLQDARALLTDNGLGAESIRSLAVEDEVAARAILREADQGRFAAVAIGKQSATDTPQPFAVSGSTGRTLLRDLFGAALWFAG